MDKIVSAVVWKYMDRSRKGEEKYGTDMDRNDLTTEEWLDHLQEELMDATIYIEKLKSNIKIVKDVVKDLDKDDLDLSSDGRRKYFVNKHKWFR